MTATTPAVFDPQPKFVYDTVDAIAGAAILGGQVVAFNSTGVDYTVEPANGVTTKSVLGVAMSSQATVGGHVSVAAMGTICKVCEGAGSAITAGAALQVGGALGCVVTAARGAVSEQIGVAIEGIAGNGTGYALLTGAAYLGKGA